MSNNATNVLIVRESNGTYALSGPAAAAGTGSGESTFSKWDSFKREEEESRFTSESPNGTLMAVGNNSMVHVYDTVDGSVKATLRHRLLNAKFSTADGYLVGWDNPSKNVDNFNIWSLENGNKNPKILHSKKLSQEPPFQFSSDEKIFAALTGKTVHFYNVPDFHNVVQKTPDDMKVGNFSFSAAQTIQSENTTQFFVLIFIPASAGPSFARLYRYPNFQTTIVSKSFFNADRTDMKWNKKGTAVLLITTTDIDKTGQSYYGKTMLHYIDIKGEALTVQTEADSNVVHAAEWSSCSTQFCVITGKMPQTRAILLNTKCEKILDMGVAARNNIHFNPQGNILLICAFGNLQGTIDVWEIKKHKKQIGSFKAADTTQIAWLNDGVHFVTATTAPRMQVSNGLKVWNLEGTCVWEWKADKHLFKVIPFISYPARSLDEKCDKLVEDLVNKPLPKAGAKAADEVKKNVYVPVHKMKGVVGAPMPAGTAGARPAGAVKQADSTLSETEKKIRAVKKKLEQIDKMKEQQAQGKQLEKNQLEKLTKEKELLHELEQLQIAV